MFVADHGPGPPKPPFKSSHFFMKYTQHIKLTSVILQTSTDTNRSLLQSKTATMTPMTPTNINNISTTKMDKPLDISMNPSDPMPIIDQFISNEENKENNDWQVKNSKKTSKNAPKEADKTTITQHETKYRFPINISIQPKKEGSKFYSNEIIRAFLKAAKEVDSAAGIGPINLEDKDKFIITSEDNIPTDIKVMNKFIEKPGLNKNDSFQARLYLHTNKSFKTFKTDPDFSNWTASEKMTVKLNKLATTKPAKVGIITLCVPRNDFVHIVEQRIKDMLPVPSPPIQVILDTLYLSNTQCRILTILADSKDTKYLQEELQKTTLHFYKWHDYMGLNTDQKRTIIHEQNHYFNQHRSLFINGFLDTTINMWPSFDNPKINDDMEEDEEVIKGSEDEWDGAVEFISQGDNEPKEIKYRETNIAQYIIQKFIAGDGCPLFEKVYHATAGKIELIVKTNKRGEAISLVKVLHGELARYIHESVCHKVFQNPENAINQALEEPIWTPNPLSAIIKPTPTPITDKPLSKKRKSIKNNNNKSTYAAILVPSLIKIVPSTIDKVNKNKSSSLQTMTTQSSVDSTLTQQYQQIDQTAIILNEIQQLKIQQNKFEAEQSSVATNMQVFQDTTSKSLRLCSDDIRQIYKANSLNNENIKKSQASMEQRLLHTINHNNIKHTQDISDLKSIAKNSISSHNSLDYKMELLLNHMNINVANTNNQPNTIKDDNSNKRKIDEDDTIPCNKESSIPLQKMDESDGCDDTLILDNQSTTMNSHSKERKPVAEHT